jgi:hypothetical protein
MKTFTELSFEELWEAGEEEIYKFYVMKPFKIISGQDNREKLIRVHS